MGQDHGTGRDHGMERDHGTGRDHIRDRMGSRDGTGLDKMLILLVASKKGGMKIRETWSDNCEWNHYFNLRVGYQSELEIPFAAQYLYKLK